MATECVISEEQFLARNRCNVDCKRRLQYVSLPLAKGILRKLTVRNIDESQGSHRLLLWRGNIISIYTTRVVSLVVFDASSRK